MRQKRHMWELRAGERAVRTFVRSIAVLPDPRAIRSVRVRGVSVARAERLVNLVLCLLSTRQYLTADRIRRIVPGYADAPSDDAYFRMFERDKTELRELGIPLEI